MVGEIGPPCGTPISGNSIVLLSIIPVLIHSRKTDLCIGTLFKSQVWLTLSYALRMSIFSNSLLPAPLVKIQAYVIACLADRPVRKPKLRGFALCSWCTSNIKFHIVCATRSLMVGIPRGRFSLVFPAFGIHTRFTGLALYFDQFWFPNFIIAVYFCSSRVHKTLSIPLVLPPLLLVTLRTAKALAPNEVKISLCIRCISLILTLFFKASYNFACSLFNSAEAFLQSIIFQSDIFNPFINGMYITHLLG